MGSPTLARGGAAWASVPAAEEALEELGCLGTSLGPFPLTAPSSTLEPEVSAQINLQTAVMNLGTEILQCVRIMPSKIDFAQLGNISPLPCPAFSNCCYASVISFYTWKPLCFIYANNSWFSVFSGRNGGIFKLCVPMTAGVYDGTGKEITATYAWLMETIQGPWCAMRNSQKLGQGMNLETNINLGLKMSSWVAPFGEITQSAGVGLTWSDFGSCF